MSADEFLAYLEGQYANHEAHGKTVRESAYDMGRIEKAYEKHGDAPHRAAFLLLTGRPL